MKQVIGTVNIDKSANMQHSNVYSDSFSSSVLTNIFKLTRIMYVSVKSFRLHGFVTG